MGVLVLVLVSVLVSVLASVLMSLLSVHIVAVRYAEIYI